jgi:hypothetical protein
VGSKVGSCFFSLNFDSAITTGRRDCLLSLGFLLSFIDVACWHNSDFSQWSAEKRERGIEALFGIPGLLFTVVHQVDGELTNR